MDDFRKKAYFNKLADSEFDVVDIRSCSSDFSNNRVVYSKVKIDNGFLYGCYNLDPKNNLDSEFKYLIDSLNVVLNDYKDNFAEDYYITDFILNQITSKIDYELYRCSDLDSVLFDEFVDLIIDKYDNAPDFISDLEDLDISMFLNKRQGS